MSAAAPPPGVQKPQSDVISTKSETIVQENPAPATLNKEAGPAAPPAPTRKGLQFWLIMFSICSSLFLSALDFTSIGNALPTIVNDLDGDDFVWIASAYALAATALLPASGGVAQVFGRRVAMLSALALFSLGGALCGSAQNMSWLIAARTIQGAGAGGIQSVTSIILSDLVSLKERPLYNSLIGLTWGVAISIGPAVGGALATQGKWRWIFFLNLPICAVSAALILAFLHMKTPTGSFKQKLGRMDWIGIFIIVASSCACIIGLTWGGVKFPWSSANVVVPLVLGFAGMFTFFVYEGVMAQNPLIPLSLLSNRTSLSGYFQTFIVPIIMTSVVWFMPVYRQASEGLSPIRSAVNNLSISLAIGPFLILTGIIIAKTQAYRPQIIVGWCLFILGSGLLSTLDADTPIGRSIGYLFLLGVGGGILYSATYFPVLAPLQVTQNAQALALFAFFRSFAGVWAVTIGTAVLQTQLTSRLPPGFAEQFPRGVAIAYTVIPAIPKLDEPLRSQVEQAYAESLKVVWQVNIGISGMGLLASFAMRHYVLHGRRDEKWGMKETKGDKSAPQQSA